MAVIAPSISSSWWEADGDSGSCSRTPRSRWSARCARSGARSSSLVIGNGCCDSTAPFLFADYLAGPNEREVGDGRRACACCVDRAHRAVVRGPRGRGRRDAPATSSPTASPARPSWASASRSTGCPRSGSRSRYSVAPVAGQQDARLVAARVDAGQDRLDLGRPRAAASASSAIRTAPAPRAA